ncbi:MAG: spore germination protein [Bacillota bacterium]|nr:spore germination protein [Bacillota bacterium]
MENKFINELLNVNETFLKNKIGESFDTKYRHFKIPAYNNAEAVIVYISGMIDARVIDETILEALMKYSKLPQGKLQVTGSERISMLMEQGVFTTALKETRQWEEICDAIMEGDTILFIDQCPSALILTTRKYEGRAVNEPSIESEIKGPRDGFVENIQTNAALIRRRIKDYSLRFDNMKIGERTKTVVSVAYVESLVDEALLNEVKSRLKKINVDGIIASEYIEDLIEDSVFSLFPKMTNTERPDKACAALLEGRVAILVDNTPFVLIVPAVFWQFLMSSGDYYEKFYLATFLRWVRIFAMFLSISASSLYVLLTSFHQEMLPTALALKIAAGRNGVPFPSVMEAAVMEIILEIMKEAGLRLPKPIGQTVSIVGTLVIGQAAVSAGLVGQFLLIVIAVAAISSYAIPSYTMSNALRLVRFPILALTAFFGLLGYLASIIVLLLHLMSLRSFGTPYLSPVIPFDKSGNKDVFIRAPWWKMLNRPKFVRAKDSVRQASGLKPKTPSKK